MKTKLSLTVTSTILLLLNACGVTVVSGSGIIVEETRDVRNYSQVVFSAPGELTINQNGGEGLVIEADDNLMQYIQTSVKGGILYIDIQPGIVQLYPSQTIRYSLDAGTLTRVSLGGSGDIRADALIASDLDFSLNGSGRILVGAVKSQSTKLDLNGSGEYRLTSLITNQLTTSLNGSGNITIQEAIVKSATAGISGSGVLNVTNIVADSLNVTISGSGDSILAGEVNHQTIALHGSGSYQAHDLQSQVAEVKISGSGGSNIWVTDELSIAITGSGDVSYRGQPAIWQTITGSGDLINVTRR